MKFLSFGRDEIRWTIGQLDAAADFASFWLECAE